MSDSFDGIGSTGFTSRLLTDEYDDPAVSNLYKWVGMVLAMRDRHNILRYTFVESRIDGKLAWTHGIPVARTRKYDSFRYPAEIRPSCLISRNKDGTLAIYWYAKGNRLVPINLGDASEIDDVTKRMRHVYFWIMLLGWFPPLCRWFIAFADD